MGSTPKWKELEDEIDVLKEKSIMTAYSETNQSVTDNTTIKLTNSVSTGEKLTLANNAILIGKGVTKVKISAAIFYQDFPDSQSYLWGRICSNGKNACGSLVGKGKSSFQTCIIAPQIIEVSEGTKLTLNAGDINSNNATVRAGANYTYITVEVVE